MPPPLISFGLSDIGLRRSNNEDVWIALPDKGFFALADGMGGPQAGEVAAHEAIHHLADSVRKMKKKSCLELIIELRDAIEEANRWVYQMGQTSDALQGMGTTLCCLLWHEEAVLYAHVGDSRIYRLRDQKLELLTRDHSLFSRWLKTGRLAEEEPPSRYKNVITRAVGTGTHANPEVAVAAHRPGDLYLLCTDGLSDVLPLEEIEKILLQEETLSSASEKLIERAKIKGSCDNMTLLIVRSLLENAHLPRQ